MKKVLSLFICFGLIFNICVLPASAQSINALKEGAHDFFTAPLQLGKTTAYYIDELDHDPVVGVVAGVLEGTGVMGAKLIGGLFKMLTFPFASEYE